MKLYHLLLENDIIDIVTHLKERGIDPSKTNVILDKKSGIATFLLYNLSGQIVGYQQYNPAGDKKAHDKEIAKYYNYITKESSSTSKLAVWGLETLKQSSRVLFVVEGVFDAVKIHNAGHAAVAVLGNNPKILKSWLRILPQKSIAITDNDAAGNMLKKIADTHYNTPSPYKDLGEMPQSEVNKFIKTIV